MRSSAREQNQQRSRLHAKPIFHDFASLVQVEGTLCCRLFSPSEMLLFSTFPLKTQAFSFLSQPFSHCEPSFLQYIPCEKLIFQYEDNHNWYHLMRFSARFAMNLACFFGAGKHRFCNTLHAVCSFSCFLRTLRFLMHFLIFFILFSIRNLHFCNGTPGTPQGQGTSAKRIPSRSTAEKQTCSFMGWWGVAKRKKISSSSNEENSNSGELRENWLKSVKIHEDGMLF